MKFGIAVNKARRTLAQNTDANVTGCSPAAPVPDASPSATARTGLRCARMVATAMLLALGGLPGTARAQSPCPATPQPPDTCPLPGGLTCSCCGTCDVPELSDNSDPCWQLSFIDGGDNCDPQGADGGTAGADGTDLIDFDGDGDLDVVTGWEESGNVLVYLNPCNPASPQLKNGCSTGNTLMAEWPKVNVSPTVNIKDIEDAVFADLDGDCVPESVITAMEGETDKVCVHTYSAVDQSCGNPILCSSNWSSGCLNSAKNHMRARYGQLYPRNDDRADALPLSCIPGNAEGCNDIVVGAKTSDGNSDVMLFWFECPAAGPGIANLDDWVRHDIGSGVWFMSVEVLDMDGDNDLDVLFSDRNRVGWFENPYYVFTGEGPDVTLARIRSQWKRHVLEGPNPLAEEAPPDSTYEVNREVRWLWYFDIDGDEDEDVDIVSTVNYDMQGCPSNSTNCTGDGDNPGIRIVAHWYERDIITSETLPGEGASFSLGGDQWLNFKRHVVAADQLPFRREDNELDTWVSKAVAAEDVNGDGKKELILTARGSGHGVYYLTTDDPRTDNTTFIRGNEELPGRIWAVRKMASAYINKPNTDGTIDGKQMKYDNVQAVDLDCNGTIDVISSEENVNPNSKGIGVVWYKNPCGNGNLDVGEQCDLGVLNGSASQCCGKTCRFLTGAVCRASASICDAEEVCQAGSGSCPANANKPVSTPCAVSACDAIPRACSADGVCEVVPAGIPCSQNTDCATGLCLLNFCAASCPDDGLFCTYDVCNGGLCMHPSKAPGVPCPDDGDPCTTNTCDGAGGCQSFDCGAENECRSCIGGNVCGFINEPDGAACGIFTGTCAAGACEGGTCQKVPAPEGTPCLTDGNECTSDVCSGSQYLCLHPPVAEGTACGDHPDPDNPCELQNQCSAQFGGTCLELSSAGEICRPAVDECDQAETCTLPSQTGGVSVCPQDAFAPGGIITCEDDGNECTWDLCDGEGECAHVNVEDGWPCPGGECTSSTCQGGVCTHVLTPGVPCTHDANDCTSEICNAAGACASVPVPDGTACSPLDWDDKQCTSDVCFSGACAHPPAPPGTPCGWWVDGACDDPDSCDGAGACLENNLPDGAACASDGLPCTKDVCDNGVCAHVPIDQALLPSGLCGFELSPLGNGIPGPQVDPRGVQDFAVFDGGGGPRLYATGWVGFGQFDQVCLVEWNGSNWSATGGGFDCTGEALAVYDDGSGPALYVGGLFYPSQPYYYLMRWNGVTWTNVDPGLNGQVNALAVFDDGGGPALYVGGVFTQMGVTLANYVVKWDGQNWAPVGALADSSGGGVFELAVVDLGNGAKLYAGGQFDQAGGSPASGIAVLDAGEWVPLGQLDPVLFWPVVHTVTSFDSGDGPQLHIGGSFTVYGNTVGYGVAKWTGTGWEAIGQVQPPNTATVFSLFEYDDGTGNALYAGGSFSGIDSETSPFAIRYDGVSWLSLQQCLSAFVSAFTAYNDGTGESLILGGGFRDAGGPGGDRVARWECTGDNDCNDNLVPDESDPDCDGHGVPDDCDLAAGGADCQSNSILDDCELGSNDANDNGVPDDCDVFPPGDFDADCDVDKLDAARFLACMSGPGVPTTSICRQVFDLDQDQDADLQDWAGFQALFGALPPGCP